MTDSTMISSTNQVEISEKARYKAKHNHITWIVWENDGVFYADRETAASLVLAMEASGNRKFYGLEASTGNGFIINPENAQILLNTMRP
ncbi:MAG TPA: hypothetical protein VI298_18430 [Geobacteraceae bacterium]